MEPGRDDTDHCDESMDKGRARGYDWLGELATGNGGSPRWGEP